MKNKILEKLQNSDGYVSGQELCELLGYPEQRCGRTYRHSRMKVM